MKISPLIYDFRAQLPSYQLPQEYAIHWLAAAHAQAEVRASGRMDLRSEWLDRMERLIRRYGCSAQRIGGRRSELSDFMHTRWEEMSIFNLASTPAGEGINARNQSSAFSLDIYIGLSVFSCLFVTKDEPVHSKHCHSGEHWLHAMLFILHPLVLLSAGLLWPAWRQQPLSFIRYTGFEREFLLVNTLLTLAFGLYQLIYWNFLWSPATSQKQARLITPSTVN